jgi:acetyl-CoA carboxylase biotin carboxyl carrier protein
MSFDIKYIKDLAKIIDENSLSEISIEEGDKAITVRREIVGTAPVAVAAAPIAAAPVQTAPTVAAVPEAPKGNAITSPMVGTFYKSPSPDAKPFVEVGQTITAGSAVCIIEAMKLMNEIESEFSGKITQICVEDGQPVEYGQVLMYVE